MEVAQTTNIVMPITTAKLEKKKTNKIKKTNKYYVGNEVCNTFGINNFLNNKKQKKKILNTQEIKPSFRKKKIKQKTQMGLYEKLFK